MANENVDRRSSPIQSQKGRTGNTPLPPTNPLKAVQTAPATTSLRCNSGSKDNIPTSQSTMPLTGGEK